MPGKVFTPDARGNGVDGGPDSSLSNGISGLCHNA